METVILITEAADLLPVFQRQVSKILPNGIISTQENQLDFVVQNKGSDRLYVEYNGTSLEAVFDWGESELAFIHEYFPAELHVYSIQYRSLPTIKTALISIANSDRIIIYNDFGTLMLGRDFVDKVLAEQNWYWFDDLK